MSLEQNQSIHPIEAIRKMPENSPYKKGDVLVLFGELFSKGYANGLVEEAQKIGMTIVRCTVGRRDAASGLRPLTQEEVLAIPEPFINVPLEAGFDLEPSGTSDNPGSSPVELLKEVKLSDWESFKFEPEKIEESRRNGRLRFRNAAKEVFAQLSAIVPDNRNVLFAHLMAGGVPRAKIVMPLMNRAIKGIEDRYLPSEKFWESPIGRICALNFEEVTAETFRTLIEASSGFRKRVEDHGGKISYLAYGYHGTEVLIGNSYKWQTYTPYLQGWAKLKLEEISREYFRKGINCCVYNCPEILTNSSSIFQGVELSLYPLLKAIEKEHSNEIEAGKIRHQCAQLLKDGESIEKVVQICDDYQNSSVNEGFRNPNHWPQHSDKYQLQKMLESSELIQSLHRNPKQLITHLFSDIVFKYCGMIMLHDAWLPQNPVAWIGHDVIAKSI